MSLDPTQAPQSCQLGGRWSSQPSSPPAGHPMGPLLVRAHRMLGNTFPLKRSRIMQHIR